MSEVEAPRCPDDAGVPGGNQAHALPPSAVLASLGVSLESGLDDNEALSRQRRYGQNATEPRPQKSAWELVLHQFISPVVYLLGGAAGMALAGGHLEEGVAILAVLAINGAIGFVTELRAVQSIAALRRLGTHEARVKRGGHVRLLPARDLVPGDIVILEAGDAVPADIRLVGAANVQVDESLLTGESVAVDKTEEPVSQNTLLAERRSMLFSGTALTLGSATGVVVATGLHTQIGNISRLVAEAGPGSSPLERKLAHLSRQLVLATLAIAALILVMGLMGGRDMALLFEASVALAVAAIPEGLPIVATLALARGMWRMARQNALVERLSAVETLGATTLILTDKTGTLTENRMTVTRLVVAGGEADLATEAPERTRAVLAQDRQLWSLLRIATLCNGAHLPAGAAEGSGDPMEVALLRAGRLAGIEREDLLRSHPLARTEPFDPRVRMMASIHESGDGFLVAVKGAPEAVLKAAQRVVVDHREEELTEELRAEWLGRVEALGRHGLRSLACAMKMDTQSSNDPFDDLVLVGLVGLEDPARADVPGAIRECRNAGIRVVMATGDHAATAQAIGRAVGLAEGQGMIDSGAEKILESGSQALAAVGIFARVSPAEKPALVRAYQDAGEVVAMTGDGVNDAPALRQADIGVAMGLRGTDVAREAAAMVLLDDAFPTIVMAIREGRVIFGNIRRFVVYLLSCNLSEVMVVAAAVILGLPLPLLPLQILYLNLVTDVFPAFALALGEGDEGLLHEPPRSPSESILGRRQWQRIVVFAVSLTLATFAAISGARLLGWSDAEATTASFLTLAFAQVWHTFNMRRSGAGMFVNEVTRNRWIWLATGLCCVLLIIPPYIAPLGALLELSRPDHMMWALVAACSLVPTVGIQASMLGVRTWRRSR
jgi:Ca2+-transporting ATPase